MNKKIELAKEYREDIVIACQEAKRLLTEKINFEEKIQANNHKAGLEPNNRKEVLNPLYGQRSRLMYIIAKLSD